MDLLLAFWLGSCLGSFVNVLVYRLPRDLSVVSPRSYCPHCRRGIAWHDNIPILSWLGLRGRCRHCRQSISWRYPAVEMTTGLLTTALWMRWGSFPAWAAAAALAAAALLAVTVIDWDTFLIPDMLSLGLLGAGWLASPINPILDGASWQASLWFSVRGAAAGFAMCWLTAEVGERVFKKEAMGGGDIKLMAAVGAWTGALGAFDCLMVASLLGSVYGIALIARGRLKRSDPIPFGPFLSGAAVFNFFYLLPFGFPFL